MKARLLELRDMSKNVDIPVADKYKLILLHKSLFTCFSLAIHDPIDIEEYNIHLARALLYYFSLPLLSYKTRIGFVQGFYDSYMVLNVENILTSVTDTSALFYDSSLEAFVARALAIADTNKPFTCRQIFAELENTLQNAEIVV